MTAAADDGTPLLALYETTIDDVNRYASRLTGGVDTVVAAASS